MPIWVKLIPIAAVAYILFPIDLRPDFIPFLGQIDDLIVTILLVILFIALAPSEARRDASSSGNVSNGNQPEEPVTLEGRMRHVDDDAPHNQ